jgi:hypothetical protein
MYIYHYHNTKHVHLPLSQYKRLQVPLSQYKTYTLTTVTIQKITSTTVTIQNMYTYHCHNTKHVHLPLSQYKAYTPTTITCQPAEQQRCGNLKFRSCYFSNLARLEDRREFVFILEQ